VAGGASAIRFAWETHMTRWMAFSGIALAALFLSPTSASARTCVVPEPMTPAYYRQWLDDVDAVVRGKVIAIEMVRP
jgi:hypothetical protein